ncbi:MAG: hypothetical protein F6K56_15435 [Moorea sp. SIO3G5]|nr:hypothetical protein [Moorena sp. SIO3G5]
MVSCFVSIQPSAVSGQRSAVSDQWSVVSGQLILFKSQLAWHRLLACDLTYKLIADS